MLHAALTVVLLVLLIAVALHDWVTVPGFIEPRRSAALITQRVVGSVSRTVALAVLLLLVILNDRMPGALSWMIYGVLYFALTVTLVWIAWYLPYLRRPSSVRDDHRPEADPTVQVLPVRGDNPRPNLAHVLLHALGGLAIVLWLVDGITVLSAG